MSHVQAPYPWLSQCGRSAIAFARAELTVGWSTPAIDLGRSDVPWTVLADPEGNEFCLLAPG